MQYSVRTFCFLLSVSALAACATDDATEPVQVPDALRGQFAFVQECAKCHASADGLDLAFFRFTDTTIIRRAVAHVDTATARDIVAHVHTIGGSSVPRSTRLFQPGGSVLSSDLQFAIQLFGQDNWPAGMTTDQLRALDPRRISVALAMPVWSDEQSNLDWMPDRELPEGILSDRGSLPRATLAGYRAAPTRENLLRAVTALRQADRRLDNAAAPCLLEDAVRANYPACFEVRRWTSSLVAQHMIRHGIADRLDATLHDVWWDVGNAARKSVQLGSSNVPNASMNWASWMYLSWSFEPSRHPSVYTGGGLRRVGLTRHATFMALRAQVARAANSMDAYNDLHSAINFAPNAWAYNVAVFGFKHLLERLNQGEQVRLESRATAINQVMSALTLVKRKVPAAQHAELTNLADQVLAKL